MAKLNQLLTLERMLEQYDGVNFEKPGDICLSGQFVMDLVDEINAQLNRHLNSKIRLTSSNVLMTNFDMMTNTSYWTKSKLYKDLPIKESRLLREKIEEMVDLLKALWLKIVDVEADFADKFLERMKMRCRESRATDYDLWKIRQPELTMERLTEYQAELTADMLIKGILKYDSRPHGEEMDGVDLCKLRKKLKNKKELPEGFDEECAKLRRYSHWEGDMFVIDYPLLRNYIYRCFRLMTNEQRIAMFYYNVQMKQLHEDMVKLKPNSTKDLNSTINEQPNINQQKPTEELFKFIHPSVDENEEWRIHNEVKRLVTRQGIQMICLYLLQMMKENKILLPPNPSVTYAELVRMGMPSGEGFTESTFRKYYRNK